jgi:hypothetical protein
LSLACLLVTDASLALQPAFRFGGHDIEFFGRPFGWKLFFCLSVGSPSRLPVEHGDGDALREYHLASLVGHRNAVLRCLFDGGLASPGRPPMQLNAFGTGADIQVCAHGDRFAMG